MWGRVAGAVLGVMAWAAAGQELAPEVLLLARIKVHMQERVARLPNYTCLETLTRFHKQAQRGAKLQPLDTVRLEIANSGGHEWYGSPGDRNIAEADPGRFVGSGMIANGMFAILLHNLFVADGGIFVARGEDEVDGRAAWKFDFRVPRVVSGYQISLWAGKGTAGQEGSIWVDRESLDLLRLDVRATEIPEFLPLESATHSVRYERTRIGDADAVLAQQADLWLALTDGTADYDRVDFTHCRSFEVQSSIRFEEAEGTGEGAGRKPPAEAESNVPALLRVTVELATPITEQDAVGKLIEGRIAGDLRHKGKVVVEDGAPVHGRIRRLDRYAGGGRFVVGLEFDEVEAHGVPMRFYADLLKTENRKGVQAAFKEVVLVPGQGAKEVTVVVPELAGVASFFVEGKRFVLPAGFRTIWRTRGVLRGAP